jgi:hypothetical protein
MDAAILFSDILVVRGSVSGQDGFLLRQLKLKAKDQIQDKYRARLQQIQGQESSCQATGCRLTLLLARDRQNEPR